MITRRRSLVVLAGLIGAKFAPLDNAKAADEGLAPVIRKVTGGEPVSTGRVYLEAPHLADNGYSVPLKISVESPVTVNDHVRTITVLSERNPRPVIATYHLGPEAGKAVLATRIRLNGTQHVLVIAELSDGTFWSGDIEVIVTESACLDDT
jgi:sulfur-oxidizing protein SoxY